MEIKEYIQQCIADCEKRAVRWEERIQAYTDKMKSAANDAELQEINLERQQCIGKKNEILAVSDFCNKLLQQYFK